MKNIGSKDFIYLKRIVNEPSKNWFKNIYLYITEKCQLHCKHCYMGSRLKRGSIMSKSKLFFNLKFWKQLGGEKVCFLGGEPTLHPHFQEIVKYANELKYKVVTMDTNGLQNTLDTLKDFSPSDFTYIQVSLDGGSPATNDKIRGKGTFNIIIENIREFCKRGFDIRIICTVNKYNLKDCLKLLPLADSLGVTLVKYHIFSGIGTGKENSKWLFDAREWQRFVNILLEQKNNYKAKIQYQPSYGDEEISDLYFKQGYRGCLGRKIDRMSIFPSGKVYICSYLFDTGLNFAKIENGRLHIKRRSSEINLFFSSNNNCKICTFNDVCFGGCPAENLATSYFSCNKNNYPVCRLWKSSL